MNDDRGRQQARDYMSKDAMREFKDSVAPNAQRARHGLLPEDFKTVDIEHEEKINTYIHERETWKQKIPIWRSYEYWQLRADFYPYIRLSDKHDDFFIRGVSVHPRLSDYPTCKTPIRDYFVCRDQHPVMQIFNMCAPLKEQFCACINDIFVRNHARGDKKLNDKRVEYFAEQKQKKFDKMVSQVEESVEVRSKFQD